MFDLYPYENRGRRLVPYNPFRDMERFFDNTFDVSSFKVDIMDKGDSFQLDAELPGFKKDDIKLSVENDILTISADSKKEEKEENKDYIRQERYYGSFSRSFSLDGIDADKIKASYTDGVLRLTLPKEIEEAPESRQITIE